jgi:hypothetical protein
MMIYHASLNSSNPQLLSIDTKTVVPAITLESLSGVQHHFGIFVTTDFSFRRCSGEKEKSTH